MTLKKFILKLLLFTMGFIGLYCFFVDKLSKGHVDEYYNKFTQEAGGLIIGISRANIGISPYVIEEELINIEKPIINFAINSYQSGFSEVYFNAIREKIKNRTNKGIFIISINPGNFSAFSNIDDDILTTDSNTILGKTKNVASNPNYNYIINNYSEPLYNAFYSRKPEHQISHNNGWNEIILYTEHDTITNNTIKYWKSLTIKRNIKRVNTDEKSQYRIDSFIKLIKFLKEEGHVFVIRIPADTDIIKFENDVWQGFDKEFDSITKKYNVPYFNYSNKSDEYKTYDGSHLESESAKKFTKQLSLDIKNYLKAKKYKN